MLYNNKASTDFYDRWKELVQNQFPLNNETYSITEMNTKKHFTTEAFKSVPEDQRRDNSKGELAREYNYDNLLKTANYKVRSKVKFSDNRLIQKQMNTCERNRYKMNVVYDEHSIWLKNLKSQVSKLYYSIIQIFIFLA